MARHDVADLHSHSVHCQAALGYRLRQMVLDSDGTLKWSEFGFYTRVVVEDQCFMYGIGGTRAQSSLTHKKSKLFNMCAWLCDCVGIIFSIPVMFDNVVAYLQVFCMS